MKERKFNLFNWQPFYILFVLVIFSGYIQRDRQNHPINNQNKIITASLTNEIEVPCDPNDDNSAALHSQFSDKDPLDSYPGKESIKDILLNIVEIINLNQADKSIIKSLFRYLEIDESRLWCFIFPPSFHSSAGIATFLVLRV